MWVNNDNGMYTTRSLKQLYHLPIHVKSSTVSCIVNILQVHAKKWLTWNLNPWFIKANSSSASPTVAWWWPFANPLPLAVTLSRRKCQREPSACPNSKPPTLGDHHPSWITHGGFVIQITSSFWAKLHVFEASGQAQTKWKIGLLFDKSHYLAGIQNSLRHRNASQSSSVVTWKSQDALTCKFKGVYTPTTLTFLALLHLQPGTMF